MKFYLENDDTHYYNASTPLKAAKKAYRRNKLQAVLTLIDESGESFTFTSEELSINQKKMFLKERFRNMYNSRRNYTPLESDDE
jgi:hypothetical protein